MKEYIMEYISTWESRCYSNGIPDEAPEEIRHLVPSYRRIAIAILKNDIRDLGFQPKESKWYGVFKRIEIDARNDKPKQLKLL